MFSAIGTTSGATDPVVSSIASVFAGSAAQPSEPEPSLEVVKLEDFDTITRDALDLTMQKYGDDMIRILEVMSGRLETLERTTDRLHRTFSSLREGNQAHEKVQVNQLKTLEKECKECLQGIQVLREHHENVVIEEQKRLLMEKKAEFSAARARAEVRDKDPVGVSSVAAPHQEGVTATNNMEVAPSQPPLPVYPASPLEHYQPQEQSFPHPPLPEPGYTSQPPLPTQLLTQPTSQPPRDYLPSCHEYLLPPQEYSLAPHVYSPAPPPPRMTWDHPPPPPRQMPPLPPPERPLTPPVPQRRQQHRSRSPSPPRRSTGSSSAGASGSSPQLSTSKVPIDKVIEDVSAMGFTKEEVRTIVKKLTEKGQSVDLNVVLDKLMNGEGAAQEPARRGWFGRR